MKKRIFISLIGIAIITAMFASCEKKHDFLGTSVSTDGLAFLKIMDFAPSFRQVLNGSDSFNVYVNGNKVNGSIFSYGSFFPSSTNPYMGVPAGAQSIRITVNGKVTPDSITLATINKTLDAGSYYSFVITDSVLSGKAAQQIFVKDNFALTDTGHFTLRFIHAILNDSLGKNVDVYSTRYAANIFSNIAPGTTTAFVNLAYTTLADTLIIRRQGLPYELGRLNGASFSRQRAYTIVYKGQPGTVFSATTAPKGRSIIQYTNF